MSTTSLVFHPEGSSSSYEIINNNPSFEEKKLLLFTKGEMDALLFQLIELKLTREANDSQKGVTGCCCLFIEPQKVP
jgi:hypothetical protein